LLRSDLDAMRYSGRLAIFMMSSGVPDSIIRDDASKYTPLCCLAMDLRAFVLKRSESLDMMCTFMIVD
jgi:hypothetical protein